LRQWGQRSKKDDEFYDKQMEDLEDSDGDEDMTDLYPWLKVGCEPWVMDFFHFFSIYVVFGTEYDAVLYFLIKRRLGCLADTFISKFVLFHTKIGF